jgi:hypothetical protein
MRTDAPGEDRIEADRGAGGPGAAEAWCRPAPSGGELK